MLTLYFKLHPTFPSLQIHFYCFLRTFTIHFLTFPYTLVQSYPQNILEHSTFNYIHSATHNLSTYNGHYPATPKNCPTLFTLQGTPLTILHLYTLILSIYGEHPATIAKILQHRHINMTVSNLVKFYTTLTLNGSSHKSVTQLCLPDTLL